MFFFKEKIKKYLSRIINFDKIIIISTLILTILTFNITKQETEKNLDPLIHYKYLSDKKRFEILSSDDVEIKTVSWLLPTSDGFLKINEFSNDLILDELKYSFLIHLVTNTEKPNNITKNFIDCYLFGSEFYKGIPMAIEVEFRRRGLKETFKQINLTRIRGSERDELYIYIEKQNASTEEVKKFKAETKEDFKIYQDFLKDYNLKGECGIYFGYPDKNLWQ